MEKEGKEKISATERISSKNLINSSTRIVIVMMITNTLKTENTEF